MLIRATIYLLEAFFAGACIYLVLYLIFFRKRKKTFTWNLAMLCFIVYLIAVARVTGLIKTFGWGIGYHGIDFIPFRDGMTVQTILNGVMFIPFGFFLSYFFKERQRFLRVMMCSLAASILIELVQTCFAGRLADVSDVIMNTLGAVVGGVLYFVYATYIRKYIPNSRAAILSILLSSLIAVSAIPFMRGITCVGDIPIWYLFGEGAVWSGFLGGLHLTLLYLLVLEVVILIISKKRLSQNGRIVWRYNIGVIAELCLILVFQICWVQY